MAGPNIRRFWANSIVFSADLLSYSVLLTDTILFADMTAIDGTMVLPSSANSAKCYTFKKIDSSDNVLTITTDNVECLLDGVASLTLTTIFEAMSCIMGDDGNYYTIVNGGGGGGSNADLTGYPNNAQLAGNLTHYELITDLTANYPNNSQLSSNLTYFVNTAQLTANLGDYTNTAQLTSNYPNTTQLSSNLANYPNNSQLSGNLGWYPNNTQLTNNLANYQTTAGLAANVFTLVANNTTYVGAVTAINVVSNAQLSGNLGLYTNTLNLTTTLGNYQTTAGLPANVATLTANNTSFVGAVTAVNVVSNAQLSANLAAYQTSAGLAANVATLTANNTSYVGAVTAVNVVSNAQLAGNLALYTNTLNMTTTLGNYQTTAGLSGNVATLTANNTSYVGAVTAVNVVSNAQLSGNLGWYPNNTQLTNNLANYQTTAGLSANVLTLTANSANYVKANSGIVSNSSGVFAAAANGLSLTAAGLNVVQSNGIVSNTTGLFLIANTGVTINSTGIFATTGGGGTVTSVGPANGIMTSPNPIIGAGTVAVTAGVGVVVNTGGVNVLGNTGTTVNSTGVFVTDVSGLTANNASYLGTVAAASYQQTGTALINNVATMSANNASYLGTVAAASYQQTGTPLVNNVATMSANNASYLGTVAAASYQQTGTALINNVATMTANNANNLGTVAATSYINIAGNYTITGNHTHGNTTVFVYVNSSAINVGTINTTAVGLTITNNSIILGNSSVNATINTTTFSGTALLANNASYLGTVAAASYQQTGAALVSNVATMTANNSNSLGGALASTYQSTGTALVNNVATMTANNSNNLGGVLAANYVNTSGNYLLSGNISHGTSTVNVVVNSTALTVGAINATAIGAIYANNYLMIGNTSINATMNASTLSTSGPNFTVITTTTTAIPLTVKGAASATANLFQVSNSGSVIFAVNAAGVLVGNGFGLTSISASITANSGIVSNATGVFANVGNGMVLSSGAIQLQGNTGITVNTSGIFATGTALTLLDSIAGSFNGATTTFNLATGGVGVTPGSTTNLLVVLGGVVQDPSSAYTVSANTISFTAAPATNEPCSIRLIAAPAVGGVAGSNSQVIFNDSGAYAGDANFAWNKTTDVLTVGNSTINAQMNSTTFFIRNAGANVFTSTNVLYTNVASQAVSGGVIVTSANLGITNASVTTITVNCGTCPLQYLTNNGAFTFTAPSNDGSCVIQMLNGASAGTITYSGWQTNATAGTGDAWNSTSGNIFNFHIMRINGNSTYVIKEIK